MSRYPQNALQARWMDSVACKPVPYPEPLKASPALYFTPSSVESGRYPSLTGTVIASYSILDWIYLTVRIPCTL